MKSNVLKYRKEDNKENAPKDASLSGLVNKDLYSPLKGQRKVAKVPFKVLDAPAL